MSFGGGLGVGVWVRMGREWVRMVLDGKIVNGVSAAAVLAAHALAGGTGRPADAPWPDRPTRFAERRAAD